MKNDEIRLCIWSSLHVFQWDLHLRCSETISIHKGFSVFWSILSYISCLIKSAALHLGQRKYVCFRFVVILTKGLVGNLFYFLFYFYHFNQSVNFFFFIFFFYLAPNFHFHACLVWITTVQQLLVFNIILIRLHSVTHPLTPLSPSTPLVLLSVM